MKEDTFDSPLPEPEAGVILPDDLRSTLYTSLDGVGLKYHTYRDIGKYTVFPNPIFETVFPQGKVFGEYAA